MTITEFLLARIAEDEAVARAAHVTTALPPIWDTGLFYGPSAPASQHIARYDPARVLAECLAKRRIIKQLSDTKWGSYAVRDFVFAELALPYQSHPDYREEWRP